MRKLLITCAAFAALSGLAMADTTWSGPLLDAHCANRHADEACYAKRSTTKFVLDDNGTRYRLDNMTNLNVSSAMQARKRSERSVPAIAILTGHMRNSGKIDAHIIAVQ